MEEYNYLEKQSLSLTLVVPFSNGARETPFSVTARTMHYVPAHLTFLKQQVSAVCGTAMFVPLHKGGYYRELLSLDKHTYLP